MHLSADSTDDNKPDGLAQRIQRIISRYNLANSRDSVTELAKQLNISILDCAAALFYLNQSEHEFISLPEPEIKPIIKKEPKQHFKLVRYRLDVGSQHQVEKEQLQALLVHESGVDKKSIGKIDIRHNYTLVELPDGMPADIFQLLSEAMIGERKLAIKRIKSNRRNLRS